MSIFTKIKEVLKIRDKPLTVAGQRLIYGTKAERHEELKQIVKAGLIAGGIATAFANPILITKGVSAVAKSVIPKGILGKVSLGIASLIGYGVLKESPTAREITFEKVKKLPDVPVAIIGLGEEVGKVIEGEKVFEKEDVTKGLKTAGVIGGIVAGATFIIPKAIEKAKEFKEKIPSFEVPEKQLVPEKAIGIEEIAPTQVTQKITTGKRPSKRRRATITPSVKQYVKVIVDNQATGIKFIKNVC